MSSTDQPPVLGYATETVIRSKVSIESVLLVVAGMGMAGVAGWDLRESGPTLVPVAIGVGGLAFIVAGVVPSFPGASYIRLGPAGFWIRQYWRSSRMYRWDEIERVQVASARNGKWVEAVLLKDPGDPNPRPGEARPGIFLRSPKATPTREHLSDGRPFGMTADGLATLLERHRVDATKREAEAAADEVGTKEKPSEG